MFISPITKDLYLPIYSLQRVMDSHFLCQVLKTFLFTTAFVEAALLSLIFICLTYIYWTRFYFLMEFFCIHKLRSLIGQIFHPLFVMIILNWNVRGVGYEGLTHEINEFVKLYHSNMVFPMKTRVNTNKTNVNQ